MVFLGVAELRSGLSSAWGSTTREHSGSHFPTSELQPAVRNPRALRPFNQKMSLRGKKARLPITPWLGSASG